MNRNILPTLIALLLFTTISGGLVFSQPDESRSLRSFDRILIHPGFDIELVQGETPKAEIISYGMNVADIHTFVNRGKLEIYHHNFRPPWNNGVRGNWDTQIHARIRITYTHLEVLDIRGDGLVSCKGPLDGEELLLRLYGSGEVNLPNVRVGRLRAALYGDMRLFLSGEAFEQRWKVYGDAAVDAYSLRGEYGKVSLYGDSDLELDIRDELSLNMFGDGTVNYRGTPVIRRGLIFGDAALRHRP